MVKDKRVRKDQVSSHQYFKTLQKGGEKNFLGKSGPPPKCHLSFFSGVKLKASHTFEQIIQVFKLKKICNFILLQMLIKLWIDFTKEISSKSFFTAICIQTD